jgi:drug/metabolite transporter (DMT)-like permease
VIYGEHPGTLAIVGAVAVAVGILASAGGSFAGGGLAYALATGTVIATYTLWDKHAVDALAIPPLFYYWSFNLITLVGLAPLALRDRGALAREWRESRREVLGVGLLAPASYVLVLSALVFTPVSFIAGTRELGIVFGSAMGVLVLGEEGALIRITTSCVILAGVVMLAIG